MKTLSPMVPKGLHVINVAVMVYASFFIWFNISAMRYFVSHGAGKVNVVGVGFSFVLSYCRLSWNRTVRWWNRRTKTTNHSCSRKIKRFKPKLRLYFENTVNQLPFPDADTPIRRQNPRVLN